MEYHINTEFNLHSAVDSAWNRLNDQKNNANSRHEEAKKSIREINNKLFQEDLNAVLSLEIQRSLNIVIVPMLDIEDTNAVFEFNNTSVGIHRTWTENTGLYWHISTSAYDKISLGDNLQSELFLLLATLKNSQAS